MLGPSVEVGDDSNFDGCEQSATRRITLTASHPE
jgi:hypothetical protein